MERALAGETDTSALPGSAPGVDLDGPRATGGDGAVERYRDARARKVAEFEHAYVTALLARTEGNASEAARLAKMDRPYLLSLLKRYGLR